MGLNRKSPAGNANGVVPQWCRPLVMTTSNVPAIRTTSQLGRDVLVRAIISTPKPHTPSVKLQILHSAELAKTGRRAGAGHDLVTAPKTKLPDLVEFLASDNRNFQFKHDIRQVSDGHLRRRPREARVRGGKPNESRLRGGCCSVFGLLPKQVYRARRRLGRALLCGGSCAYFTLSASSMRFVVNLRLAGGAEFPRLRHFLLQPGNRRHPVWTACLGAGPIWASRVRMWCLAGA